MCMAHFQMGHIFDPGPPMVRWEAEARITGKLVRQLAWSSQQSRVKRLWSKTRQEEELTPKSSELYMCAIAHVDACGHVQYILYKWYGNHV